MSNLTKPHSPEDCAGTCREHSMSAEAMSYGVRCNGCGMWETQCVCEGQASEAGALTKPARAASPEERTAGAGALRRESPNDPSRVSVSRSSAAKRIPRRRTREQRIARALKAARSYQQQDGLEAFGQ